MNKIKKHLVYFLVGMVLIGIDGCVTQREFVVPSNPEYLKTALDNKGVTGKIDMPFVLVTNATDKYLRLSSSGLLGGIFDSKTYQVRPSIMMSETVNAIAESATHGTLSSTMKLELVKYNYGRLEYGFGTSQSVVWLTVMATLANQGKLVDQHTYISRAQCGPPFSTGGLWQSGTEAPASYAIATYKALIVAIEQAIHQKSLPLDKLRDSKCISYTKNDTWDLSWINEVGPVRPH